MKLKEIGRGQQYRVIDLGNGRVRKLELRPLLRYQRIMLHSATYRFRPLAAFQEMHRGIRHARDSVAQLKRRLPLLPRELLGNPLFLNGTDYEQDAVLVLGSYLASHREDENRLMLTRYAELIQRLWEFGIADAVFNFTINAGVSRDQVIQIDLGEFIFDKEEVKKQIRERKWERQWSFASFPEGELKNHYRAVMARMVTPDALEERWGKAIY
jgi:hypothetical protein